MFSELENYILRNYNRASEIRFMNFKYYKQEKKSPFNNPRLYLQRWTQRAEFPIFYVTKDRISSFGVWETDVEIICLMSQLNQDV